MEYSKPPRWAIAFLRSFCHDDYLDEVLGDLQEMYMHRQQYMSARKARWLFIREVFQSVKLYVITGEKNSYPSNNQTIMIRNYFTIALRNLKKKKLYSGINLLGLSVGMACSILILLFVLNELSYDKFHTDHERIMRITETIRDKEGNIIENSASGPWSVGPTLQSDFPDAVVTRMYKAWQKDPLMVLKEEDVMDLQSMARSPFSLSIQVSSRV